MEVPAYCMLPQSGTHMVQQMHKLTESWESADVIRPSNKLSFNGETSSDNLCRLGSKVHSDGPIFLIDPDTYVLLTHARANSPTKNVSDP